MGTKCNVCNRPLWDGGGALSETTCDEPGEILCLALRAIQDMIYDGKSNFAKSVLLIADLDKE